MHYYQFNIKDWVLHTAHLTLIEEAVYRRVLDYYYDTEQPIPRETQLVIRRLRLVSYEETLALILSEFFDLEDDGYHNYRADLELKAFKNKADKARQNGRKGGRPPKNKGVETQLVNSANPDITEVKANQEPITNNHEPLTINKPSVKTKRFTPPSNEEVYNYFVEQGLNNQNESDNFCDYWQSMNWSRKSGKIKDWKATVRTWIRNNYKAGTNGQNKQTGGYGPNAIGTKRIRDDSLTKPIERTEYK